MKKKKSSKVVSVQDSETIAQYESILLEEMRGNFKVFGESLEGLVDKVDHLGKKVDHLDMKIDRETTAIRVAMNTMHQQLDSKIEGVRSDLTEKIEGVETKLTEKIEGVRSDLTGKIESVHSEVKDLSKKVDRIEAHITSHDEDIRLLKHVS